MKRLLLFCVLAVLISCESGVDKQYTHYNFTVDIEPSLEKMEAELQIGYIHHEEAKDTLKFYLFKPLNISELKCNNYQSHFVVDSSDYWKMPFAKMVFLVLNKAIDKGQMLDINIKYSGKVKPMYGWNYNQISNLWIELNNLAPWYLYSPNIDRFTYGGLIRINGNHMLIANANIKKDDHYFLSSNDAVRDISILAVDGFENESIDRNGMQVNLIYKKLEKEVVDHFSKTNFNSLLYLKQKFGSNNTKTHTVFVTDENIGLDYSRNGIYRIKRFDKLTYVLYKTKYQQGVARGMSKSWFNSANPLSWHNWLNESLAEYSALLILKNLNSQKAFDTEIELKKAKSKDLPPLKGISFKHPSFKSVMQDKVVYILYRLANKIGEDSMLGLMKSVYKNQIGTTEAFINLLKDKYGQEVVDYFSEAIQK